MVYVRSWSCYWRDACLHLCLWWDLDILWGDFFESIPSWLIPPGMLWVMYLLYCCVYAMCMVVKVSELFVLWLQVHEVFFKTQDAAIFRSVYLRFCWPLAKLIWNNPKKYREEWLMRGNEMVLLLKYDDRKCDNCRCSRPIWSVWKWVLIFSQDRFSLSCTGRLKMHCSCIMQKTRCFL